MFIPFIAPNGAFTDTISTDHVSSVLRKVIYLEYTFTKEFLGLYFMNTEITKENFQRFKTEILNGIEKMGDDILYKDKAKAKIQLMDFEEIKILWQKTCEKIPSPYISQDIYDLIVFRKNYI